jgi:hypothetical protein
LNKSYESLYTWDESAKAIDCIKSKRDDG